MNCHNCKQPLGDRYVTRRVEQRHRIQPGRRTARPAMIRRYCLACGNQPRLREHLEREEKRTSEWMKPGGVRD
jgi:hypothetical protein